MDKIDKILDLIENTEELSPGEIDRLLADPEMRELYDALGEISGAFHASDIHVDTDCLEEEWTKFRRRHLYAGWRAVWHRRHAAVIGVVVVTSMVAVGMGIGISMHRQRNESEIGSALSHSLVQEISVTQIADSLPKQTGSGMAIDEVPVEFENETLEMILAQIAAKNGLDVKYLSTDPKSLRLYFVWDPSQSVEETVAQLDNFERFSVHLSDDTIIVK